MSDKTGITWTDATWNPVTGCTKVSQGCKHCYAEREWVRLSANPKATAYYGRAFTDIACHEDRLDQPLRWKKPRMIFVNSMSDLFHEDVPDVFIDKVFAVMALAEQHVFQVLTKRPERMLAYLSDPDAEKRIGNEAMPKVRFGSFGVLQWPLPNVWLGVSVENQEAADARIPLLLQTLAAVRWVSAEPLLGPVDLARACALDRIKCTDGVECAGMTRHLDWVVVGGESGQNARPMHPDWVLDLQRQCDNANVPFFFKQWGAWLPINQMDEAENDTLYRSNQKANDVEDQARIDEIFGTHCTKPVTVVGYDGMYFDVTHPMAFQSGRKGMTTFQVGAKKAGCKLDGKVWQAWPEIEG